MLYFLFADDKMASSQRKCLNQDSLNYICREDTFMEQRKSICDLGLVWFLSLMAYQPLKVIFVMFKTIPHSHFYNVYEGGNFGRLFIISSLSMKY